MQERFETFTVLVAKINRNIRRIKNEEMKEYKLRSPHISCLYYLYLSDNLTATEICEHCEEDKATISRSLDYLETHGYLVCESKLAKRWKSPLTLTALGKEVGKKITNKVNYILNEVGKDMTDDERLLFYKCLSVISDNLEAIVKDTEKQT